LSDGSHTANDGSKSWTRKNATVMDVPEELLFRYYSRELYPHADQLVDYMNYYRVHHQLDAKIRCISCGSSTGIRSVSPFRQLIT
jgi:hypothetical protein